MQNVYIWKDLLYKEVRSTLTATNPNIKILHSLNTKFKIINYTINRR